MSSVLGSVGIAEGSAFKAMPTKGGIVVKLGLKRKRFGIVTPFATKGATLEKDGGTDSVAVVNLKGLDGKNHRSITSLCAIKLSCIFLESLVKYSFQPHTRICRVE